MLRMWKRRISKGSGMILFAVIVVNEFGVIVVVGSSGGK
jgi:hypothetical protein